MECPNIELTTKEFNKLKEQYFDYGSEGIVIKAKKKTIYKIFRQDNYTSNEEFNSKKENKLKKIIELFNTEIDNKVKILSTISNNGIFVGYEMTYDKDDEIFLTAPLSFEDKIDCLKTLKEKLQHLEQKEIVYGDIKSENILVNRTTHDITFCDLDNIKIKDLEMDLLPEPLLDYKREHGSIDKSAHAYMHNLFLVNELTHNSDYLSDEINCFSDNIFPEYFDEESKKIAKEMIKVPKNYTGRFLIDRIK